MLLIFYAEREHFPLYGFRFSVFIECEYPLEDESFNQCGAWYLYQLVTQTILRTHKGNLVFSEKKTYL